jgi:hypothetical protein
LRKPLLPRNRGLGYAARATGAGAFGWVGAIGLASVGFPNAVAGVRVSSMGSSSNFIVWIDLS